MVDISRRLWRARLHGETPSVERPKGAERLTHAVARYVHRSDEVQAILAHIKWKTLPFWLGFAMWLTIAYAVVTGVTQLWLARVESRPGTCPGYRTPELVVAGRVLERRVNIDDPCTDLGWALQPGKAYRVEVELTAAPGGGVVEWRDAGSLDNTDEESQAATPDGWVDPTRGAQAIKGVAKFSQRVVTIPLMTPVFELRRRALIPGERPNPWWFCNADATSAWCDKRAWRRFLLGDTIHMFRANLRPLDRAGAANLWGGTITAPPVDSRVYSKLRGSPPRGTEPALHRSGHLFVFANDAVIPFDQRGVRPGCPKVSLGIRILDLCGAYSGNRGSYLMRIWLLDGSPREQAIDRQLRRRCQQFTDRQRCLTVFAREPPPN